MEVVTRSHDKSKMREQPSAHEDKPVSEGLQDDDQDLFMTGTKDDQGVHTPSTSPFLRLPAELRNDIYGLVLLNQPETFWVVFIGPLFRGTEQLSRPSPELPHRVALLRVNRQIHAETLPFLYNQQLKFATDCTLRKALSEMGAADRARLTDIKVWHAQPGRGLIRSAVLLKDAAASLRNLSLTLWYRVPDLGSRPPPRYDRRHNLPATSAERYASRLCSDMYPLLETISETKGVDAAIALVGSDLLGLVPWAALEVPTIGAQDMMFNAYWDALRTCIITRQNRNIAKNVAKSKDFLQGDANELKSLRLRSRVVERHQKRSFVSAILRTYHYCSRE